MEVSSKRQRKLSWHLFSFWFGGSQFRLFVSLEDNRVVPCVPLLLNVSVFCLRLKVFILTSGKIGFFYSGRSHWGNDSD